MASFFLFDTQPAIHAAADSAAVIVDTARVSAAHEESENLFTHLLKHVQDAHQRPRRQVYHPQQRPGGSGCAGTVGAWGYKVKSKKLKVKSEE